MSDERSASANPWRPSKAATVRVVAVTAGVALFAVVLLRTAWLCDDAYITFRVLDNAVAGHGLRWNVIERVQVYTHPLWMLLLLPLVALTGDVYYTSLAVSAVLSLGAFAVLAGGATRTRVAVLGMAAALASMAFVDFSTSGLENALAHLLLVSFALCVSSLDVTEGRGRLLCAALAGLIVLNRLDHAVLVGPAMLVVLWARPIRQAAQLVAVASIPLLAWECFAVAYYGFALPNTAWAKLAAGIPAIDLCTQGLKYLQNSLHWDPITLPTVGLAVLVAFRRPWAERALALGATAYLTYIVSIGGDHMAGRFLSAPFVVALCLLVRSRPTLLQTVVVGLAIGWVGSGARTPPLASSPDLAMRDLDSSGIADEHGYFYQNTGFLRPAEGPVHETRAQVAGHADAANGQTIALRAMVGWYPHGAGPSMHIIDPLGLTDPLLARMPKHAGNWRVGHNAREVPKGYAQQTASPGLLDDPDLGPLLEDLYTITRGPLWSAERWAAIWRINLGGDGALERYCARRCSLFEAGYLRKTENRRDRTPFRIPTHGVAIATGGKQRHPKVLVVRTTRGRYRVELRQGDETIQTTEFEVQTAKPQDVVRSRVALPYTTTRISSVRLFPMDLSQLSTMSLSSRPVTSK